MSVYLLVGNCGSGKTWVMKRLIENLHLTINAKVGLIRFKTDGKNCVLGNYDGTIFEGSDKLSMAVAKDFNLLQRVAKQKQLILISEGDRFMNKPFIETFKPYIIKILDEGTKGRKQRGSTQSERQLKSISTRVKNIKENITVKNSTEALNKLLELICKE